VLLVFTLKALHIVRLENECLAGAAQATAVYPSLALCCDSYCYKLLVLLLLCHNVYTRCPQSNTHQD
jgi:hypothetical protein